MIFRHIASWDRVSNLAHMSDASRIKLLRLGQSVLPVPVLGCPGLHVRPVSADDPCSSGVRDLEGLHIPKCQFLQNNADP